MEPVEATESLDPGLVLKVQTVWGRTVDVAYAQSNDEEPSVHVLRFAPTWKPWASARSHFVYVTTGMSESDMPGPSDSDRPRRVELCAYADREQSDDGRDLVVWALHSIAHSPWRNNLSLAPLDTFSWGGPLIHGSDMAAFFFAVPDGVDVGRLCLALRSPDLVLQVVPISEPERQLALRDGSEALLDRLEKSGVPPHFDLQRQSTV